MSEERRFAYESLQDSHSIQMFLKSLEEGFEKGTLVLQSNEDQLELSPSNLVNFSIKAKKKSDSCKIQIKIEWKDSENK
ncbi:MAG TPA: amphi-Trp domain-containing protein [Desulfohalobiaceae bacterium]|nr:amphi-Trp domain-containing protein [Desulfohalobiaceae bacterium]